MHKLELAQLDKDLSDEDMYGDTSLLGDDKDEDKVQR